MARRSMIVGSCFWLAACAPPASERPSTPAPNQDTSSVPAPTVRVAPAPSGAPADPAGANSAPTPAPGDSPFSEPALPRHPNDLSWLTRLVKTLSEKPATREQVIAYLGQDGGADTSGAGWRRVQARSQYLERVLVYPMSHVRIEVAMDITFAKNGRPSRSTVGSALGAFQAMPTAPDNLQSGPKLAHYEKGPYGTVRVFIELDKANNTEVASVHVDVDGVAE